MVITMTEQDTQKDDLTPAQVERKAIWAGALERAGIPAESMDWKQPEMATPLYAHDSTKEKQPD